MHTTGETIHKWYGAQPQEHREHLGASLIGHPCERHLWLTFRWAQRASFEGRMLRLFERGRREETLVAEELAAIGVELHTREADKQIECRDETGHFGGSVDGIGRGFPEAPKSWAVLEVKTHSASSWNDVNKKGVAESKPQHWAQMQVYMGLLRVDRALYLASNKNTDEIYTEWVHFDQEAFDELLARARRVLEAKEPPVKLSDDPAHWQCKGCQHFALCHEAKVAEVSCRTCCHASPVESGAWRCELHSSLRNKGEQVAACDAHLFIPTLVPFGEPVDGGVNFVEYRHRETGASFTNGPGHYSSRELEKSCAGTVTEPVVEKMRAVFNAKVIASKPKRRKADLSAVPETAETPFFDDDVSDIKV